MDFKLNVQSSPHVRDSVSTRSIMLDVIIALLPATIWGIIRCGYYAGIVVLATILAAVLSETIFNLIMKKPNTIDDLSAVVTGLLLGLNMPPEIPIYVPVVGAVFAIVIVKMLFGGLGQNFMNPALAGRCFLLISFTSLMNDFSSPMLTNFMETVGVDAVSSATPLAILKDGGSVPLTDMFLGYIPGTIGEISTLCLLVGALYLIIKKVISIRIPFIYIFTFVIFLMIFSGRVTDIDYILGEVLGGGLIFGALFMATDYVTCPVTPLGQILYAIFLGVLTGVFRIWGKSSENVSYCILIANLIVPLLEQVTIPKAFGKEGK